MVTKKKNIYDNTSISSLKGEDRVRKRPSVIFGSDGIDGCAHSFFEILSNSIDEAREGYGDEITIIRHLDYSITVIDNGRGIPLDYNTKEKKFNWELIYCELYAGGKYHNAEGANYAYSLGLNGLGACATQYASEYMDVTVFRDGFEFNLHFEKGRNIGGLTKKPNQTNKTGSIQKWRPDLEVFTDIDLPIEFFQDVLKKQAVVNDGVKFILKDEQTNMMHEYIYENGIRDYVDEINQDNGICEPIFISDEGEGRDREDKPDYRVKAQIAFLFNNKINALEYFHNSSFLEHGGSPDKAVKQAFVYEIDKYIKKLNKYTKNEKKISFVDVQDSLILVSSSFSTMTSYENQTKKAITNRFIQTFIADMIKRELEIFFIENKLTSEKIIDQILINKRSREKAEKTRLNLKKTLSEKIDIKNRVKKFVDCRTKDVAKRELYILEGDSALGACKMARNAEFQALLPVRGKILNCLKADYGKIFASDIIVDLIKVLGCGVEIQTRHNKNMDTFSLDKLQWDKIIICTDADVDGYQIRTLILTMLYRLVPTLINEGKVFIAESPLYEINTNENCFFAYNEVEKTQIVNKIKTSYTIQRSKGLGENEPEMMWKTTMSPESRRLIKVSSDDPSHTQIVFDRLLGDDIDGRKKFIEEHGHEYIEFLDLN